MTGKFLIPDAAFQQNAIVLGKTRSGKSSAMRFLIEGILDKDKTPPCIIDPKGDWWGIKLAADGRSAGYPLIIFGGKDNPRADIQINDRSGAYIAELIATGNRPCLIDLGGWRIKERTRFFIEFSATLFKTIAHPLYLVIDECHNFAPKGKLFDPEAAEMLHWANRLASEGLGKGVMLLSASQRPQKVHNDYLTSHETLIAKKVIHKSDRDAVKDWIDGCGDPALGKEIIASIAQLQKPEAWGWSPEVGFGPKKIEFPFFKTYDSFKPQTAQTLGKLKGWASVDLDDVRAKLATVVEEAKANDPAALKTEIARLKAELAKKSAPAPSQPVAKAITTDQRAQDRALAAAREEGAEAVRQAVPAMLDVQHRASFEAGFQFLAARRAVFEAELVPERKPIPAIQVLVRTKVPQAAFTTVHASSPAAARHVAETIAPAVARVLRSAAKPRNSSLDGAQQRILNGLRELEVMGVPAAPRVLVAMMANYSHLNSKGFVNAIGSLRTAGLVEYLSAGVALTDAGRVEAHDPDMAITTESIQERIVALLGGASGRILEPLLAAYPASLPRQDVAYAAGYGHLNSKGFVNAIGRLRTLGFVDYPGTGDVVATALLFPGGR